jgi:hypothetical protein
MLTANPTIQAKIEGTISGQITVGSHILQNWFGKNVLGLAGAVLSVVVHPIVGKLVEAAGDLFTTGFRKRFGRPG